MKDVFFSASFFTLAAAVLGFLTGAITLIVGLRNSGKITEVHISVDGKMEKLIAAVEEAAFARGILIERDKVLPVDAALARPPLPPTG